MYLLTVFPAVKTPGMYPIARYRLPTTDNDTLRKRADAIARRTGGECHLYDYHPGTQGRAGVASWENGLCVFDEID